MPILASFSGKRQSELSISASRLTLLDITPIPLELSDSFGINNLKLGERSQPIPAPGEVLVKI